MDSKTVLRESGWSPLNEVVDERKEARRFGIYIVLLLLLVGIGGGLAS
jgi:hypothetical protein